MLLFPSESPLKFLIKIFLALFGLFFLLLLYLSLKAMAGFTLAENEQALRPEYSYAFFLPALDYPFFDNLKRGALEGAADLNCTITFYQIDKEPLSLEMAPFSGADGIALYPTADDRAYKKGIERLAGADIPLLYLEHNLSHSASFFIGTNSYEVGKKIGELVRSRPTPSVNCAFVFSEKSPGLLADRTLVEMGFRQIMANQLPENLLFERTDRNPLGAESLVSRLLRENPSLDTLIFTDSNDTMAAVQVLVDRNLVGKVDIVGFGDDRSVVDYVTKGIIRGTVVRDPYQIGYQAVEILKGISERGNASAYVDIGSRLISQVNVGLYGEGGRAE